MKYVMFYVKDVIPYLLIASFIIFCVRFYKYKKYKTNSIGLEVLYFIFYLYLTAVLLETVVPSEYLKLNFSADCFHLPSGDSFYNNPEQSYIYIRAFIIEGLWFRLFHVFILNFLMLLPFGIMYPILYPKRKNMTVFYGFLISFTIEFIQLFTERLTDTFDIYLNTLGVITGYLIYILALKIKKRRKN